MTVSLIEAAGLAILVLQLVYPKERVGDAADRLAGAALLLQDVRRLLQAGDPVPEWR